MKSQCGSTKYSVGKAAWTLAILNLVLLPYTSCGPVKPDFYHHVLYQINSGKTCLLLPNVTEDKYLSQKINKVCNSSLGETSARKIDIPSNKVCQSLQDLFPKLCELSKHIPSGVDAKANSQSVDLNKVNSLGVENFCKKLAEVYQNVSRSNPESWVSPFQGEGGSDSDNCKIGCKNTPDKAIGGDEKFEIGPECMLLFEGYNIYQRTTSPEKISEVSPDSNIAKPITTDDDKGKLNNLPQDKASNSAASLENKEDKGIQSSSPSVLALKVPSPHDREHAIGIGSSTENAKGGVPSSEISHPGISPGPALQKEGSKNEEENTNHNPTSNAEVISHQNPQLNPNPVPNKRTESTSGSNHDGVSDAKPNENLKVSTSSGKPEAQQQQQSQGAGALVSSSTRTSTSTSASVDRGAEDVRPPMKEDDEKKIKSSTAIPQQNEEKKPDLGTSPKSTSSVKVANDKTGNTAQPNSPMSVPIPALPAPKNDKIKGSKLPKTDDDIEENNGAGEEDDDGYDIPDVNGIKEGKQNADGLAAVDDGNANDNYIPKNQETSSRGTGFNGMPYSRGTTINVSLNESEDTGFFNYFLFCATLVGLMYLVFHNKKKLIAYVVEGKRPRGRSRRSSSSSSQYRRLENNFD